MKVCISYSKFAVSMCLALITSTSLHAQKEQVTKKNQPSARVIGGISSGVPSPKASKPAKENAYPTGNILRSHTQHNQGRTVTLQEIEAPSPQPAKVSDSKPALNNSANQLVFPKENIVVTRIIGISAETYTDGKRHLCKIVLWTNELDHSCVCWSNIDIRLLNGFGSFQANNRVYFPLVTGLPAIDANGKNLPFQTAVKQLSTHAKRLLLRPQPSFVIASKDQQGKLAQEIFQDIHTLVKIEKEKLSKALNSRIKNAKLYPPKPPSPPKDITIRFWKNKPRHKTLAPKASEQKGESK
ncbi:MAG: hypothetical protein ACPG32_14235 [Akkermansiaceae bacterium]